MEKEIKKTDSKYGNLSIEKIESYTKLGDLEKAEIQKMEVCDVVLKKTENKKNNSTYYTIKFVLKNGMEFSKSLEKNEYLLICLKRHLDQKIMIHNFVAPVRFLSGDFVDNDDFWLKMEVLVVGGFWYSEFLKSVDKNCVRLMDDSFGYKIFITKEKVDKISSKIDDSVFEN